MRIKSIPLVGCFLIALVMFGVLAANGGESENDRTDQCPFGIIEGPDPIGLSGCLGDPKEEDASGKEVSNTDPNLPPGLARSAHGRPDFGHNPQSGQPFMVWADSNAGEHDIAVRLRDTSRAQGFDHTAERRISLTPEQSFIDTWMR